MRALDRRPWCSHCKSAEHYTRGCKLRFQGPHTREDDALVESFFCTSETEPDEQKNLLDHLMQ